MCQRLKPPKDILFDIARVEDLVRSRFDVGCDEIILVSQDQVFKPGFPMFETNIVFFKNEARYKIKIFSRISQVQNSDLPLRWLLPALEDNGELDCC